jgi:hypothetical protein
MDSTFYNKNNVLFTDELASAESIRQFLESDTNLVTDKETFNIKNLFQKILSHGMHTE